MGEKTAMGLDENIEGALCYLLGWVTGLIFYLLEKNNKFVKFHAMQSIILFLGVTVVVVIFMWIPFFGWIIDSLIGLLAVILWIVLMIKAYQGEKFKLPFVGDIAEKHS